MRKRGRNKYVPFPVLNLLGEIKEKEGYKEDVKAWDKLAFLGGVGLNVEDGLDAFFGMTKKRRKGIIINQLSNKSDILFLFHKIFENEYMHLKKIILNKSLQSLNLVKFESNWNNECN